MAWRKGPDRAKFGVGRWVHGAVRGAADHRVNLPRVQQAARVEQRSERRRASSVHRVVGPLQIEQVGHTTGHHVGQFTGHRVFGHLWSTLDHRIDESLAGSFWQTGFNGEHTVAFCPDALVGFVPVLSTERVGEHHANPASVKFPSIVAVTGMLEGRRCDLNGPKLAGVDLRQRTWRLPPSAPVEFESLDESADFGVRAVLFDLPWTSLGPKLLDRPWPAAFGEVTDADA